jgi:hypothetical protein
MYAIFLPSKYVFIELCLSFMQKRIWPSRSIRCYCPVCTKIGMCQYMLAKLPERQIPWKLFSNSRVVAVGRTDR